MIKVLSSFLQKGWEIKNCLSTRTILTADPDPCHESEDEEERDAFFVGESEMKSEVQED